MNERAIDLVQYQARWAGEFAVIASGVRDALGGLALRIDHIGSTAVSGLASKDIIDVQLTLASFQGFKAVASRLSRAGYRLNDSIRRDHIPPGDGHNDADYEKRYFHEARGERPVHLHVRAAGRANQRYAVLFRDYLRAHPAAALAYAETKRRLQFYHNKQADSSLYFEIKDPVCDLVMAPAEDWAAHVGWSLGESDG